MKMTPDEFALFVSIQAQEMAADWKKHREGDGDLPARLSLDDWWRHFSELIVPEAILALAGSPRAPAVRIAPAASPPQPLGSANDELVDDLGQARAL